MTDTTVKDFSREIAKQLIAEQRNKREQAEAVFANAVAEKRDRLKLDEIRFIKDATGLTDREIKSEFGRAERRDKFQSIAGTGEEREKLYAELERAEGELKQRGPELQEQITELEKELKHLQSTADRLSRRKSDVQSALENLRDVVPAWVREDYNERLQELNSTLRADVNLLKTEIHELEVLSAGPPNDDQQAVLYFGNLRNYDDELVVKNGGDYELSPKFEEFRQYAEEQLPKMKESLAKMESEYQQEKEALDEMLQEYWR